MPYILKENYERAAIEPRTPGELNFAFTRVLIRYVGKEISAPLTIYQLRILIDAYIKRKGMSYTYCNDIMGAITGALTEYNRRTNRGAGLESNSITYIVSFVLGDWYADVVAPYEDKKIAENGDVYPTILTGVTNDLPS